MLPYNKRSVNMSPTSSNTLYVGLNEAAVKLVTTVSCEPKMECGFIRDGCPYTIHVPVCICVRVCECKAAEALR